jgi:hypothetical protein
MNDNSGDSQKLLAELEKQTRVLEDLFILQAYRAGIKQQEIRALLRIDIRRVARIAKHVKTQGQ